MDETQQFSHLVGDIYDASLNPDRWMDVLEQAASFLKSATATLGSFDAVQRIATFTKPWGYDPEYLKVYFERYATPNPLVWGTWLTNVGDVVSIGDLMPYEEYRASAIFQEWGVPQGYIDAVQATIEKTATALAFFHVIRHEREGLVDDEIRRRMKLLAPHLRRALLIGKVIDLHKIEAASFADALDGLAAGMFLVDVDARIVHANIRGREMLSAREIVIGANGWFSVRDSRADKALHEVFAAAGSGDNSVGTRGITVPIAAADGGGPFVAHVLPLTSGARRQAGVCYSAAAAVFVRKAALDAASPIESLVNFYMLTPAEMRVLMAIIEVGGVPEVSPILGISEPTVRTHLQRIFEKTGTNRQADLVKLVAGFVNPLG
jgi:DNA-binding CsgD family transcriptional regulator